MKAKIELNANAISLRRRLGEDAASPIDVFAMINRQDKFSLVYYPMSDLLSGMCVRTSGEDCLIAINSRLSYGRQRFTAAHELYHFYFQDQFTRMVCGMEIGGSKNVEEKNADAFASFFLAPYEALISFIEEIHPADHRPICLEDVVRIEQYFGMSRQATLVRLKDDGLITSEIAETWKSQVIKSARRFGYDDRLYLPTPEDKQYLTTGSYITLAERLRDKDIISQGKYEEYLLDAFRSDIVYNLNAASEDAYD